MLKESVYTWVKNIHLGPTIPGFLSPNVVNILVSKFGIGGIGSVDEDLQKMGIQEGDTVRILDFEFEYKE